MPQGPFLRKYGASATINFHTFEVDGINLRKDAAPGTVDLFIMKDNGAEAATTNAATDEGRGYSLVLTATEMQAARIVIYVEDQTGTKVWLDTVISIETYGNASAQHAFDLDVAIPPVNVTDWLGSGVAAPTVAGVPEVDVTHMAGGVQTVTDLKDFADAGYNPATNKVQGVVLVDTTTVNTDMAGTNNAALASVATEARLSELDAATAGKMANQMDIVQIDTTTDIPATITTLQSDTDDIQTRLPAALVSGRIDASVGAMASATITAAAIATDAIGSAELAATAVNEIRDSILSDSTPFAGANVDAAITTRATPAQVNVEVVDVINTDVSGEPGQGTPSVSLSLRSKIDYLFKNWRNRKTQTATQWNLFNDDATTIDHKATVSDDTTTADKTEIVSGP